MERQQYSSRQRKHYPSNYFPSAKLSKLSVSSTSCSDLSDINDFPENSTQFTIQNNF